MSHEDYPSDNLESNSLERLLASDSALPSGLGCPDCGGGLWQVNSGQVKRYVCHIGHAFLGESLLYSQSNEIERHLWSTLRLLREHIVLARQLVTEARSQNRPAPEIEQFEAQIQQSLHQTELLRQALLSHQLRTVMEPRSAPSDQRSNE